MKVKYTKKSLSSEWVKSNVNDYFWNRSIISDESNFNANQVIVTWVGRILPSKNFSIDVTRHVFINLNFEI